MDKNFVDIINNLFKYLDLKKECLYSNYENLLDVFDLFMSEVFELTDVVKDINIMVANCLEKDLTENQMIKDSISFYEENLVNELADVLLTSARLIHEFNLQEALSEMIEYKYERQVGRELNRFKNVKNELLK